MADMRVSQKYVAVVILLLSVSLSGQHKRSFSAPDLKGELRLGMTRDEISLRLGRPRFGAYFTRKTSTNLYSIELHFVPDATASQLHPVDRLAGISFTVDHPSPPLEVLQDMPEAVDLCRDGCEIFGRRLDTYPVEMRNVVAYVAHPSPEQSDLAARLGSTWRKPDVEGTWTPAIILSWRADRPDSDHPAKPIDWLRQPVERAEVTSIEPEVETRAGRSTVSLGTWRPKP